MKKISDWVMRQYFKRRKRRLDYCVSRQDELQGRILHKIISNNRNTAFGKAHSFKRIMDTTSFKHSVPIRSYEDIFPFIQRMMQGEQNVLCRNSVKWFAKSSGTSTGKSKFIPVTKEYLQKGHLECAWDAACYIYHEDQHAALFSDKSLIMGGSIQSIGKGIYTGDISGIIIKHFPAVGRHFYTPDFGTALLKDWDQKINNMASITAKENVVLAAGVPTWLLVLFRKILEQSGAENMSQVWPNLRSFLHGGVNFEPYRTQFEGLFPSTKIRYREVYNASEGYFGFQADSQREGMLLMCHHGVYYEFVPWVNGEALYEDICDLKGIQKNQEYALVISNISGLYRYLIGDIVRIVDTHPVKIKVCGRVGAMINVFGEELSSENTDRGLAICCAKHDVVPVDYTLAPVFMENLGRGGHEWYIEFEHPPEDQKLFARDLDNILRELNSDYDAKRSHSLALDNLIIKALKPGSFEKWMRKKGKYGGQNKVPRLRNDRKILEELDALDKSGTSTNEAN